MIGFGNFRADDLIQLLALVGSICAAIWWALMMRKSRHPFYFFPIVIASLSNTVYYFCILFVRMDVETATSLSAWRSLTTISMILLSALSMSLALRYGGRL